MILVPRKSENHWQNVRVLLVYIWRFASDCCKFSNFSLCWTGCKFTAYARVMYYMSTHSLSTMDSKIDLFALLLLVLSLSGKIKTCYFYLLENCVCENPFWIHVFREQLMLRQYLVAFCQVMRALTDHSVATKTGVAVLLWAACMCRQKGKVRRSHFVLEKLAMSRTWFNPLWVKYNLILHHIWTILQMCNILAVKWRLNIAQSSTQDWTVH